MCLVEMEKSPHLRDQGLAEKPDAGWHAPALPDRFVGQWPPFVEAGEMPFLVHVDRGELFGRREIGDAHHHPAKLLAKSGGQIGENAFGDALHRLFAGMFGTVHQADMWRA